MQITVKLKLAWWVRPYLQTLYMLAWLHGVEPDGEKAVATIAKLGGIRVETD